MARRGYHRHRLSQRVLPHIRDVPRLLSFAGALAGVGLAAAPAPTPALLLTVTLAAEGKSAEGEAVLARVKPRMEKFPLVGGSRLFADLAEGILALKQGEAANAEQRFRAALGVYRTTGWRNALRRSLGLALVDPFRLPLVNIAGVAFRGLPGYIVYWITVLQRSIS